MQKYGKAGLLAGICVALACFLVAGCGRPPQPPAPEYMIRAGSMWVSPDDFLAELDLKLAAYPYDIRKSPDEYNEVVLDLVATLSEEILLLAAASQKEISVSKDELEAARQEVRSDYPENSFEEMLLEDAVSPFLWEQKLKRSLVIQKLMQQELMDSLEITPDDVRQFFANQPPGGLLQKGKDSGAVDETRLLKQLRMEKGQGRYHEWVHSLKQAIPVHVNKEAVTRVLKTPTINDRQNKGTSNG